MPHVNKADHNAYFRAYNQRRWLQRRARLTEMLGGKCVSCGTTENVQFDHIDPKTKLFAIAKKPLIAWERLVAEARKCQLLCRPCHDVKTATDRREALRHQGEET